MASSENTVERLPEGMLCQLSYRKQAYLYWSSCKGENKQDATLEF